MYSKVREKFINFLCFFPQLLCIMFIYKRKKIMLKKLKERAIKHQDMWYLTIEDAAVYCKMEKLNLYNQIDKFNTCKISGIVFIEMEDLQKYNQMRELKEYFIQKEKSKNEKNE